MEIEQEGVHTNGEGKLNQKIANMERQRKRQQHVIKETKYNIS